ncbi:MAG: hypothetical protein PHQ04_09990 [Opitutaceae bacterium]|nr:hypothetical protein [Opitutaceae bacterium]
MKRLLIYLGWILLAASLGAVDLTKVWGPRASFQVTFRVIDEEGRPVEGAKLGCGWGRMGFKEPDAGQANLLTGQIGEAVVTGRSVFNEYAFHAEKPGYYETRAPRPDLPLFKERANGRWQPWNPTVPVVLKRIKNPAPMFAKHVIGEVPTKGQTVGYDLEVGDWVAPYGKGKVDDMQFYGIGEVIDRENYSGELTVTFPGPGNGIQALDLPQQDGSTLRMPYEAPAENYAPRWTWRTVLRVDYKTYKVLERVDDSKDERNFYFRVRAVVDAKGKVIQAWYGKIHGPFQFGPRGKGGLPGISFRYYLNPDGTRNVEFDPKRNLFHPQNDRDSAFWNLGP